LHIAPARSQGRGNLACHLAQQFFEGVAMIRRELGGLSWTVPGHGGAEHFLAGHEQWCRVPRAAAQF